MQTVCRNFCIILDKFKLWKCQYLSNHFEKFPNVPSSETLQKVYEINFKCKKIAMRKFFSQSLGKMKPFFPPYSFHQFVVFKASILKHWISFFSSMLHQLRIITLCSSFFWQFLLGFFFFKQSNCLSIEFV